MANIRRIHPGIYIKESLQAMEMTAREFAARTGISERTLSSIINGNGDITFDVAYKLSQYFDNSISFWTNLQTQYNVYMLEESEKQEIEMEWDLVKSVKKYLVEIKIISENDSKEDIIHKCRERVGVNSLLLLNEKDSFVCLKEQHAKEDNNLFFQNFWIALALNEARKKNGIVFNKKMLFNSINEIRSMTVQSPEVFYPRLKEILNDCGVSFVLLPYLPKSNIYGATKWFSKENVMLAVSNRGRNADLFWFTLFHEIGHVLNGNLGPTSERESEADEFARRMLIPEEAYCDFIKNCDYSNERNIISFANSINRDPGIVLGRLLIERKVKYSDIKLCRKFRHIFDLTRTR